MEYDPTNDFEYNHRASPQKMNNQNPKCSICKNWEPSVFCSYCTTQLCAECSVSHKHHDCDYELIDIQENLQVLHSEQNRPRVFSQENKFNPRNKSVTNMLGVRNNCNNPLNYQNGINLREPNYYIPDNVYDKFGDNFQQERHYGMNLPNYHINE